MGLSLLAFDTDRIKEYVFATGILREIRGASNILDRLNRSDMPRLVGDTVAYAFGGSGLFAVPTERVAPALAAVRRAYAEATGGAATITGVALPLPDDFDLATGDIRPFWRQLGFRLAAAKLRPPTVRVSIGHPLLRYGDTNDVDFAATRDDDEPNLLIDPASALKRYRNRELRRAAERDGRPLPEDFAAIGAVSTPSGYFALIVADGDGMGRALDDSPTFGAIRDLARGIDTVVRDTVTEATRAMPSDSFDVLLLGGDDLVLAVPAQHALSCALALSRGFAARAAQRNQPLSLSVSVVWAHIGFPFAIWHELADSALAFAKRERARRRLTEGLINFLVVSSANHISYPNFHREVFTTTEHPQRQIIRTLRPYTAAKLELLLDWARRLRALPRTKLAALDRAVYQTSSRRSMLEARRLLVHWRGEATRTAVQDFVRDLTDLPARSPHFPFAARSEEGAEGVPSLTIYATPLADLAELWDFIPGGRMRSERIELRYRLLFQSPYHFGTGLRSGLVHRSIARNRHGDPYVPGSTLKGVLRDHATRLCETLGFAVLTPHRTRPDDLREFRPQGDLVALVFGSRFEPGSLSFDDAALGETDRQFFRAADEDRNRIEPIEVRTQVSISRRTGTARGGFLFSSEFGIPSVSFEGRIWGILRGIPLIDDTDGAHPRTYSLVLLLAALNCVERLGGGKSAGAGQVAVAVHHLTVDGRTRSVGDYLDGISQFQPDYYALAAEVEG